METTNGQKPHLRIIVDAYGGDNAPLEILRGAALAVAEYGHTILLTGNEADIRRVAAENAVPDRMELLRWLDGADSRMARGVTRQLKASQERLDSLAQKRVLTDPAALIADKGMQLDHLQHRLAAAMRVVTDRESGRFAALAASLDALSPLRVLGRGYALAQTEDGTVLRSAAQTAAGERIRVRLAQGHLVCDVAETKEE